MSKPVIVVIGGTGTQGGPVAKSLLNTGEWTVRCITRNVDSKEAKNLKSLGIEVMKGDANDKEALKKCLDGAYGIYAMTSYFDMKKGSNKDGEYKAGCLMADVAKEMGVKHFIWSSLDDTNKISKGKCDVPMFTGKNKVEEYILKKGFPIVTFAYVGFYMQNFLTDNFKPIKEQGKVTFRMHIPESTKLCLVNIDDLGPVVAEMFRSKSKYNKQRVPVVGSVLTLGQMLDHYQRATGNKAELRKLTREETQKKIGDEMTLMFDYFRDFGHFKEFKDFDLVKRLYPHMMTWDQWVKQTPLV